MKKVKSKKTALNAASLKFIGKSAVLKINDKLNCTVITQYIHIHNYVSIYVYNTYVTGASKNGPSEHELHIISFNIVGSVQYIYGM